MIMARMCVVWSIYPIRRHVNSRQETPESTPYFCGYIVYLFLDTGDPTVSFNFQTYTPLTLQKSNFINFLFIL